MNKMIPPLLLALMLAPVLAQAQEAKPSVTPSSVEQATATATKTEPAKTDAAKVDTAKADAKSDANFATPKHKCAQPIALDKISSDTQQKNFVKEVDAYRDCLIAFRHDMNRLARANVDAGNAAVEEFNAYVASLNKK